MPQELFFALDNAFANYDLKFAFTLVEKLCQTGKDLSHFFEQLIEHYRNITLAKTTSSPHPSSSLYSSYQAIFILDLLVNAEGLFQKSASQRISLESILLQIIRSRHRVPIETLIRTLTEKAEELPTLPPEEKPEAKEVAPPPVVEIPAPKLEQAPVAAPVTAPLKHPSHYDTLIRFAAVELEGTVKK